MMKIGFITLGCDKNTVDTERYLAQLAAYGGEHTDDLAQAEVIVVNTCGFIDAAKKESIDAILEASRHKVDGVCQAVVALGCMVQRHKDELADAIPEVDLFLGTTDVDRLIPELQQRGLVDAAPMMHPGERVFGGDAPHVRYLKVSEGCDHGCAFCAIPLMRGRHRSFALADVIREAQLLELQGAREVSLVAQDLAHYGRDRRDGTALPELLEALLRETGIPWFRNLYLYNAGITPRFLDVVANNPRILPYLDMPVQHGSDAVLTRMRRPERRRTIVERVARFRDAVPDLTIRTTCIVGFPGETDDDFEILLDFLGEMQFDRVGAFTYSAQEGTSAAAMVDDVPDEVKHERLDMLQRLQSAITAERYERHIGRTVQLLIDRAGGEDELAVARAPWQADDIDGVTHLDTDAPIGSLVDARITDVVDDYDFEATATGIVLLPPARSPRAQASRTLPLMASSSIGSFGR
ncbi:MAG: 30S ribosomal protein S12 methylthiotransferase RimO [Gemmatimonadaceae bacterium]|nr:30S ribosomal protein S12 methylthiotransferase RimO [Gemmatimonadaceae bacterium]